MGRPGPNKNAAMARLGVAVWVERPDQLERVGHGLARVAPALVGMAEKPSKLAPTE